AVDILRRASRDHTARRGVLGHPHGVSCAGSLRPSSAWCSRPTYPKMPPEEPLIEDQRILSSVESAADLERHVAMIADEFRRGFEAVAKIDRPAVTMFGSARVTQDNPACVSARAVAGRFAQAG